MDTSLEGGSEFSHSGEEGGSRNGNQKSQLLREQDRFLPIANIGKIMRGVVPDSGKISKEAKECIQECVSEFISFITSEASDRCHLEKRKTINGEDLLFAMSTLGLDQYVEPLKLHLQRYRESDKSHGDSGAASS
ncbi:nuclear transcription factor Y subunit beta-like [Paramacrobiotus metropolitanus]|uniref:nuclear transcription factor Y subunit beta-like n=1 Tax=Paramacrobiotus metropolitanus TaxID=2943436 RepID=UPI0024463F74|nr:nuclear transcription factor Y subunit beta-like [Paramacrobiotus metropolitanus]